MSTPAYFDEGQQYNVDAFLQAIAQRESGGEEDPYNVVADSGARGKYQFMPETYAGLAERYGLDANDWSPSGQDAMARAWATDLLQKYGPRGAAQAWLGGEGSVGNDNFADGNGTTTGSYADDVVANMQNFLNMDPNSAYGKGSGPYQTNLLGAMQKAGVRFNNPNEPLPMDFINRMMSQPTVNASQRVMNDFLQNQAPELTARAMGVYDKNKDFFNMVNKMSADAAREGAGIENKNMQKTMAAQFADQIAKSNNSANIAILAKLGSALTGVPFDPQSKQLADVGAVIAKQIELNNNATKQQQAQANADRQFELEKMKTMAYLNNMNNKGSYSKGGAGSGAGSSGGSSPIGYVLEDEDSIKNTVDTLTNSPQFKQYQNIIWDPSSTPEARDLATKGALKTIADFGMALEQSGKRGSANKVFNDIAASVISQAQEMSHPAGTNPADQAAQNEVNQGLLNAFMNTAVGTSASGQPITLADVQNSMNATENMVAQGQLVNRW